ncbi:hypothetical protein Kpol_1001p19 [Vanderwaltozyma polyspora DSM 70294]|uniref:Protein HID1 n=1 Tax=Vanderwaltozyma polyspora (strain ATCC 22028 / DSM 70294 / BCRC 21397 / CBS 2163 / NBRC 10782 / NRRL Y-8283 / UCD 57-17) TaxID=436907 RepID=A7TNQ6_VANPO|nr:uncharacterized protein Kpol_1001p19 [Vanderwaltozyma polyspora DSM 70294]EDO16107.1 hypothetical protein Kpol_1001p19 [Vanderwaltozyma polyspora DSM 70294]
MGNTDSKLNVLYRDHVFRLSGYFDGIIPLFSKNTNLNELIDLYNSKVIPDDSKFDQFYLEFVAVGTDLTFEMLNQIINNEEMRNIFELNPINYLNLTRFTALQIHLLTNSLNVPSLELLKFRFSRILVCIRVLTKLMPLYFELQLNNKDVPNIADIFWTNDPKVLFGIDDDSLDPDVTIEPLGLNLVKSCVNLLFVEAFTIPSNGSPGLVSDLLWDNGINTQDAVYHPQNPKYDSNRLEIINLLLSLSSKDLYLKQASKVQNLFLFSLSYLVPEYDSICLISSLINVVCRHCTNFKNESTLPYTMVSSKYSQQHQLPQLRSAFIISSLQLLNIMCSKFWLDNEKLIVENLEKLGVLNRQDIQHHGKTIALSYVSTLNRELDLKLMLTSFAKIFKHPVEVAIEQETSPFGSFPSMKQNQNYSHNRVNSNSSNNYENDSQQPNTPNQNLSNLKNKPYNNIGNNTKTDNTKKTNTNDTNENNSTGSSLSLPVPPTILPQVLILFTTIITENKSFENYVADKFANKFIIFSIYYMHYYNHIPELQSSMIPLCSNLSLYLSSKKLVLSKMLDTFTTNYYTNKLPDFFKLSSGNINNLTYRDFSVVHICNIIINDVKENVQPRPWLYELLYNLIQIPSNIKDEELIKLSGNRNESPSATSNGGLNYNASITLLHLISKLSNKMYLTSNSIPNSAQSNNFYACSPGYKLDLLSLVLRSMLNYIVYYYEESLNLLFALTRHQKVLLQVRESLLTISKSIDSKSSMEGVNKVQETEYYDFRENTLLLQKSKKMTGNNNSQNSRRWAPDSINNNSSSVEVLNQYILLDKKLKSTELTDNESNDNDEISAQTNHVHKNSENNTARGLRDYSDNNNNHSNATLQNNSNNNHLELMKTNSNSTVINGNKGYEIHEHMDYEDNIYFNNRKIFLAFRPEWPIGIGEKIKIKSPLDHDLSKTWGGASTLSLLIKFVRIMMKEFPTICTINTAEYFDLVKEISTFKEGFVDEAKQLLPIYLKDHNEPHVLKLDLTNSNFILKKWMYVICWSDIFDSHTGCYTISENSMNGIFSFSMVNNSDGVGSVARDSISEMSALPSLERKVSNGTMLSRTNSNSSFITGYLSNQNYEQSQTPLDIGDMYSTSPSSNNNYRHKRTNSNSDNSFFKFSWMGFNKNNDCNSIKEDASDNDSEYSSASAIKSCSFILDVGLLKPNIWAGTNVKLFKVVKEEKKEFSLLNMTSSLLKRFRFNNNNASSSNERLTSIKTTTGNGSGLHPSTSNTSLNSSLRAWTPRSPLASNGGGSPFMFSPKGL